MGTGETASASLAKSVTDRRVVERLRVTAAQLGAAQLAVAAPGGDPNSTVVLWASDACLELLQLGAADLAGLRIAPAPPGSTGEEWTSVVAAQVAAGPASGRWAPATVTRLDGSSVPVRLRVTQVRLDPDDAGAGDGRPGPLGWVVGLELVTDVEVAVEQGRQEAEHRFVAVAEAAPVGIVMSDVGARLGFVNQCFAQLLGRDGAELLGTRWLDAIGAEDRPALQAATGTALSGGSAEALVRVRGSDEVPRWLQFRFAPVTTPRRAAGFVAVVEDVTDRRAREAQLDYHANRDALTGLVNRRGLLDRLSQLTASRRTGDRRLAVLFCDLDGFKQINDTLGHQAGDQVLVEVARRLSSIARQQDLVARLAGDEFVVVLHGIEDVPAGEGAAARYLAALCRPVHVVGRDLPLKASVGVAVASDGDTSETLLAMADRAMYEAKAEGPGRYRVATGEGT